METAMDTAQHAASSAAEEFLAPVRSAADEYMASSRKESTVRNYKANMNQFGKWLSEHDRVSWRALVIREGSSFAVNPQGLLEHNCDPFIEWLKAKQGRVDAFGDPDPVSAGTLKTYRSALVYLYQESRIPIPAHITERLSTVYKGVSHKDAELREKGFGKVDVGKEPMPFSLYCQVMKYLMASKKAKYRWAAALMVLQWNTCSRSVNTASIHVSHLSWAADSLLVHFSRSKTDRGGTKPKHKAHIFANPVNPAICSLLNLALYLIEHGESNDEFLFPGGKQEERYGDILREIWRIPEITEALDKHGLKPEQMGTRSIRKGAATYGCGGSPQGVGIISMCIRAAWQIGSVLQRYLHHESAGDCVAGRTLAGLPPDTPEFALLPPHFPTDLAGVDDLVKEWFPSQLWLRINMRPILRICCAQVVYHYDFLKATLCDDHVLRFTATFQDRTRMASLRDSLVTGTTSDFMTGSGVPVWCSLVRSADSLQQDLRGARQDIAQVQKELMVIGKDVRVEMLSRFGQFTAELDATTETRLGQLAAAIADLQREVAKSADATVATVGRAVTAFLSDSEGMAGAMALARQRIHSRDSPLTEGALSLAEKLEAKEAELERLKGELEPLKAELEPLKAKVAELEAEIQRRDEAAVLASAAEAAATAATAALRVRDEEMARAIRAREVAMLEGQTETDGHVIDGGEYRHWLYDNAIHQVPRTFEFPKGNWITRGCCGCWVMPGSALPLSELSSPSIWLPSNDRGITASGGRYLTL